MNPDDLQRNYIGQTRAVSEATRDPQTMGYLNDCLLLLFSGMYGDVPEDDAAANDEDLITGEGRIVARYKQFGKLTEDIYIIACFSASNPHDIDYNNTMVMYRSEY